MAEFRVAMMSTCTHNGQVPTTDLQPAIGTNYELWIYAIVKKHSVKVDQLILANRGNEHA